MSSPSLLLLPSTPSTSRPNLNSTYRAPITSAILKTSELSKSTNRPPVLVLAVATPILSSPLPAKRHVRWQEAQSILAGLYSLIAAICAEQEISCYADASAVSIDPRVLLIDHDRGREYHRLPDGTYESHTTNIINLATFATSTASWHTVFHPSSEAGYELLTAFLELAESKHPVKHSDIVPVEGGLSMTTAAQAKEPRSAAQHKEYHTVILGGTFDYLHLGHKLLLHATALLMHFDANNTSELIIGVSTTDQLKKKKYADQLQPWDTRVDNVMRFLATVFNSPATTYEAPPKEPVPASGDIPAAVKATFLDGKVVVRCAELVNPFGPTIEEQDIDAIVVSGETRSGGKAVNDRRVEKGWYALDVYEVHVLDAKGLTDDEPTTEDFAAKISSSAIRQQRAEHKHEH